MAVVLTVRRHQAAMFTQLAVDRFIAETVAHVCERLPRQFAALGEEDLREAIHYGIGRARSYGISTEVGARAFIDVMLVFGPAFDTDPKLPWAARWLTGEEDEATRVRGLIAAAAEHVQGLGVRREDGA